MLAPPLLDRYHIVSYCIASYNRIIPEKNKKNNTAGWDRLNVKALGATAKEARHEQKAYASTAKTVRTQG